MPSLWARILNFFFDIEKRLNAIQEINDWPKYEHKHKSSSKHKSSPNYKPNSHSNSHSKPKPKPKPKLNKKMSYTGPTKHEIYYQIAKYNDAHPHDFIHLDKSTVSEIDKAKVKSLESHEKFMQKNYSMLQRTTKVFIPKLNKIMEMEINEQAMAMNWDLFIQEAEIILKLLKESKLEIEAELSKLAKEAKVESRKEYNESQKGKGRATFSFLGTSSDSQIARELQKQEEDEYLARVKKNYRANSQVSMRSERERLEKEFQDCSAALERLEGAVRGGLISIERVRDKVDRLRHEIQRLEQEARQKEISAKESKTGGDRLMQEYQLLASDRRRTENAKDLLDKERLENQRMMDSLALEAETRKREDQKLTKLQEKGRERGRSPVQKEHHQQATPLIFNVSPNRRPFINVQPPAIETQREQIARRERERQQLEEENKQRERERRERKERDREREDQERRRREREKTERKQREDHERRRREQEQALANALARKSVPELRALPEGVRHVTLSTAEQAIQEDRQKNHGKVMDTVRNVLSPSCLMKSPGTRDRSPIPSIRSQQEREREARKKAVKEVAREDKTMVPTDLLPPAKVEAANTGSDVQTPAGSPKIPAEAGPTTALPVKKLKTGLNRKIRFNVPEGGKAESIAESSNTTPAVKKLQKRSLEDLRKHVNRTEDNEKMMNDAAFCGDEVGERGEEV